MGTLLNGREQKLFDQTSVEVLVLAGADDPILWKFVKHVPGQADIDCLYKEPATGNFKHYKAYKIMCHFENPETQVNATDEGREERWEGRMWFSRKNLEDAKVPADATGDHLQSGDIVQLFSKSKKTWYFEILNANREIWEHNSDVWTHYVADVVHNESFAPERKITP